jgi:tRNA A-37 threonylcarbamoyl transferase component Bud32
MEPMAAKKSPKKGSMSPLLQEGQSLGKYKIVEQLGRGGMAQVYKAYHAQLDRYVAVKVLRSDLVEEAEFLARFRREARAVAALRHPNIVQVYDFDTQDDLYYMVMELLEGDTLKTYLNAYRTGGERIPPGEMVRILSDALSGLAYAHSQGIIHRDLKPANIMLSRHGQAVLTDFGIAQIVGSTQYTVAGALMGTLNYMAPEQGMTGHCDARSDIYSLGIVFYEMLTGRVPYDADTPLAILMKHVNDPLQMPHELAEGIPDPLERVAIKALAKQAEERYQAAEEMATALKEAATECGIEIPATLALPMPAIVTTSVFEPVVIFSGDARQNILDASFAADETDVTLGRKIDPSAQKADGKSTTRAALGGVGVLIGVNLLLLWLSGIFGWDVFGRTWPLELVSVGVLLLALMAALAEPFLLVPGGILLGNGLILLYCSLTGWWQHWAIFWPLEPILIAVSIIAPFWFKRRGARGTSMLRTLGIFLVIVSILAIIFSLVVATILALAT